MENLNRLLEEWILAIAILTITVITVTASRAALKRLHKDRGWLILREIAPSLTSLLYIFGFRLFLDVAPLHGKAVIWIEGSIYVFSIILCLYLAQKAALLGIEWGALKTKNIEGLHRGFIPFLRNLITLFVFFSGGIMILKHFNYDVMSLVTALGVSSLAVGLAAKDTLSNMISGFILIIDRNLKPGDRINLGGSVGDVIEIGLRSTQLKMPDGNMLIVPNTELVNTKILNLSIPSRETTCSTLIRVSLSVPFSKIRSICLAIIQGLPRASQERTPSVNLVNLAEGQQVIQISFWVKDLNDSASTLTDFHEKLLSHLEQETISLLPPMTR